MPDATFELRRFLFIEDLANQTHHSAPTVWNRFESEAHREKHPQAKICS